MEHINLRNQQRSPLLRLPAELRDQIYKHVLGGHDVIVIVQCAGITLSTYDGEEELEHYDGQAGNIALRLTCRLIRYETSNIFFTTNTFKVWEIEQFALRKHHLKLRILQQVTTFWFRLSEEDMERILRAPYLSEIIQNKVPLLQGLKLLKCIKVRFPKTGVPLSVVSGAAEWESFSRFLVVERIKEAFEKGSAGKAVKVVDAAANFSGSGEGP